MCLKVETIFLTDRTLKVHRPWNAFWRVANERKKITQNKNKMQEKLLPKWMKNIFLMMKKTWNKTLEHEKLFLRRRKIFSTFEEWKNNWKLFKCDRKIEEKKTLKVRWKFSELWREMKTYFDKIVTELKFQSITKYHYNHRPPAFKPGHSPKTSSNRLKHKTISPFPNYLLLYPHWYLQERKFRDGRKRKLNRFVPDADHENKLKGSVFLVRLKSGKNCRDDEAIKKLL